MKYSRNSLLLTAGLFAMAAAIAFGRKLSKRAKSAFFKHSYQYVYFVPNFLHPLISTSYRRFWMVRLKYRA